MTSLHTLIPTSLAAGEVSEARTVGGRARGDPRSPHSSLMQRNAPLAGLGILWVHRECCLQNSKGWGKAAGSSPSPGAGNGPPYSVERAARAIEPQGRMMGEGLWLHLRPGFGSREIRAAAQADAEARSDAWKILIQWLLQHLLQGTAGPQPLAHDGDNSKVLLEGPGPVWGTDLGRENPHHLQEKVRGRRQGSSLVPHCCLREHPLPCTCPAPARPLSAELYVTPWPLPGCNHLT